MITMEFTDAINIGLYMLMLAVAILGTAFATNYRIPWVLAAAGWLTAIIETIYRVRGGT